LTLNDNGVSNPIYGVLIDSVPVGYITPLTNLLDDDYIEVDLD
jgi:hypothetical protein